MKTKLKRGSEKTIKEVCLRNLGVKSTDEINAWFKKSYDGGYRLDGLNEALEFIESKEWDLIRVIGDYDIDGVTSTAQARLALSALGYTVDDRIPRRFTEGFGLNPAIVEEVPELDNVLLITIDNGIAALDAITLAKKKGFSVIVIDHHLPVVVDGKVTLPPADVIIDPNAIEGSADFNDYCGSALAYKVFTALIDRQTRCLTDEALKRYKALKAVMQPLAMMGTIGDVTTLREENYVIARNGLSKLDKRCATPGTLALADKMWVQHPVASDIGFKIGPCINANGRLFDDGAGKSVNLLSCMDYSKALPMANEAVANNNTRKQQVEEGLLMAKNYIVANGFESDLPLVVYLKDVNEGIIGIIAGKLREEYGTVAIVFTNTEDENVYKGSGRSTDDIHLKNLLDEFSDCFVKYGGHAGAAGMSIKADCLEKFRRESNTYAKANGMVHEVIDTLNYDLEITEEMVPSSLDETLAFGPFGNGNEAPVFKVTGFRLNVVEGKLKTYIGKNGVKLYSDHCTAIGFGLADALSASNAETLTLYGMLSYSYFKGEATPQIEIIDFEEEITPDKDETPLMRALRERAANK